MRLVNTELCVFWKREIRIHPLVVLHRQDVKVGSVSEEKQFHIFCRFVAFRVELKANLKPCGGVGTVGMQMRRRKN